MSLKAVLLVNLTDGKGGGIERYAQGIEGALRLRNRRYTSVCLHKPNSRRGPLNALKFGANLFLLVARSSSPVQVILTHRNLLPFTLLLRRLKMYDETLLVYHGVELWGPKPRRFHWIARHSSVRPIAVSHFTAGALSPYFRASVLRPGIDATWFETLVEAGRKRRDPAVSEPELSVSTVCRLNSWEAKGIGHLIEAIDELEAGKVRLTICGSGDVPASLSERVATRDHITVRSSLSDQELASVFADSDVFVLASRFRVGAEACGEGYGMVLAEAQLAGAVVVGPASGGSADAYDEGATGLRPRDESARALVDVLRVLAQDSGRRRQMARRARCRSAEVHTPQRYADDVLRLLDESC